MSIDSWSRGDEGTDGATRPGNADPARPDADGRARRWAGQRDKRRQEIIEAALDVVDEHGAATTAEQIASGAGVPRPQLYRYFTDTDELHAAVLERIAVTVTEEVGGRLQPGGAPARLIDGAVRAFVEWMRAHSNGYDYVLHRSPGGAVVGVKDGIGRRLTDLLTIYSHVLGLDSHEAHSCAFAIIGMVEAVTVQWLQDPGGVSSEQIIQRMDSWAWCLLDQLLRDHGVELDPDQPLPPPEESWLAPSEV